MIRRNPNEDMRAAQKDADIQEALANVLKQSPADRPVERAEAPSPVPYEKYRELEQQLTQLQKQNAELAASRERMKDWIRHIGVNSINFPRCDMLEELKRKNALLSEPPSDSLRLLLEPVMEAAEKSVAATSEMWAGEVVRLLKGIISPDQSSTHLPASK